MRNCVNVLGTGSHLGGVSIDLEESNRVPGGLRVEAEDETTTGTRCPARTGTYSIRNPWIQ